jgi:biopolymer transport protein ExbB
MDRWRCMWMAGIALALVAGVLHAQEPADPAPTTEPTTQASQPAEEPVAAEEEITTGRAFLLKLRQGGVTMIFLLIVSIVGVGYTIERLINLRRGAIAPPDLADEADALWRAGKFDEVAKLETRRNCTLARTLAIIARHRRSSMADVSMMAGDVASRDLKRHLQRAYPLAVVATIAPLLGLFGTVLGMIGAFDKVAAAGSLGDASLLGGDISKALITTGAGLAIAVPALALYHFFKSRISLYGILLEEEVGELISDWFLLAPGKDKEGGNED